MIPQLARAFLAAVIAAFLCLPARAGEARVCDRPAEVHAVLAERYGEVPVGRGVGGLAGAVQGGPDDGALLELLVNPGTRSWTLLLIFPRGNACLIGRGTGWEPVMPALPGRRS